MTADAGGPISQKLSEILAETLAKSKGATATAEAELRARFVRGQMETWERELAVVNRATLADVLADPDVPQDAKDQLAAAVAPTQQVDFFLGLITAVMSIFSLAGAVQQHNVDFFSAWGRNKGPHIPLDPSTAGIAYIRGAIPLAKAEYESRHSGLNEDRLAILLEVLGEPPSLGEMLMAFRRGIIDEARLEKGIRQSATRNEWIDMVKALRYQPAGAAQAIQAAVEGHLTREESIEQAQQAGLDPKDWPWLYETAGNPPGTQELLELLNRGEMTTQEVTAAIRESNVKNKYIPTILKMRRRLIPQEQVRMAVRDGSMTLQDGLSRMMNLGYDAADAAALIALATTEKVAPDKRLAQGQVVQGYMDREFDRDRARIMLTNLGYDSGEAEFLLDLADNQRERRFKESAIGRVRSLYISRKIERDVAGTTLDGLAVPAAQRDDLLKLWDLERAADVPDLTPSQVGAAVRRGLLTFDAGKARIQARGYTPEDAEILLLSAFPLSEFGGGAEAGA